MAPSETGTHPQLCRRLPDTKCEVYGELIAKLGWVLRLHRSTDTSGASAEEAGPARVCECGRRIWVVPSVLHLTTILADAAGTLREFCIEGARLNRAQIDMHVERPLMLVTALFPVIGYDRAAAIAQRADAGGTTLREAAVASGDVTAGDFDRIVDARVMTGRA